MFNNNKVQLWIKQGFDVKLAKKLIFHCVVNWRRWEKLEQVFVVKVMNERMNEVAEIKAASLQRHLTVTTKLHTFVSPPLILESREQSRILKS